MINLSLEEKENFLPDTKVEKEAYRLKSPQPNSNHCFVCGLSNPFGLHLRFFDTEPGVVASEVTLPEQYQGYPGVVHGGIIAAMLDEAAGRSHMVGAQPRFMYTARLEVRYRKNVPIGQPLMLVGRAGESKRRTAKATSAIYDEEQNLLAEADAVLVDIPAEVLDGIDPEALGWRIYPPETELVKGDS
jgi:acyl-coenzyme A thioesterase PaaI-like protein